MGGDTVGVCRFREDDRAPRRTLSPGQLEAIRDVVVAVR